MYNKISYNAFFFQESYYKPQITLFQGSFYLYDGSFHSTLPQYWFTVLHEFSERIWTQW